MKNIFALPIYVGIILRKDNKVFLVKRINTQWASGYWNFPGGLVEEGETAQQAAVRETREEVGVIVCPDDFQLVHVIHIHASASNTNDILGLYFISNSWTGTPINNEPHRHSEIGWFSLDQLPKNITEHALLAIDGLTSGKQYSEHGWEQPEKYPEIVEE